MLDRKHLNNGSSADRRLTIMARIDWESDHYVFYTAHVYVRICRIKVFPERRRRRTTDGRKAAAPSNSARIGKVSQHFLSQIGRSRLPMRNYVRMANSGVTIGLNKSNFINHPSPVTCENGNLWQLTVEYVVQLSDYLANVNRETLLD